MRYSSHLFLFNDTATTEIYTLSLHDALPILPSARRASVEVRVPRRHPIHRLRDRLAGDRHVVNADVGVVPDGLPRSEEHTSELQSQSNLVCRLLLEKKKKTRSRKCTARSKQM